jgi:hypothetical protein
MKNVVIERKLLGHFNKRVSLGVNKVITKEMLNHMSYSKSKMGNSYMRTLQQDYDDDEPIKIEA